MQTLLVRFFFSQQDEDDVCDVLATYRCLSKTVVYLHNYEVERHNI